MLNALSLITTELYRESLKVVISVWFVRLNWFLGQQYGRAEWRSGDPAWVGQPVSSSTFCYCYHACLNSFVLSFTLYSVTPLNLKKSNILVELKITRHKFLVIAVKLREVIHLEISRCIQINRRLESHWTYREISRRVRRRKPCTMLTSSSRDLPISC